MLNGTYAILILEGKWTLSPHLHLERNVARQIVDRLIADAEKDGIAIIKKGDTFRPATALTPATKQRVIERLLSESGGTAKVDADFETLRRDGQVVHASGEDFMWLAGIESRVERVGLRCEVSYEMYLNDIVAAVHVRLLNGS